MVARTRLTTRHRRALAAFAALAPAAAGLAVGPQASGQTVGPEDDPGEAGDKPSAGGALGEQARLYALDYDVDLDEARRRLASLGGLTAALTQLRDLAGERFAGIWIEHEPDFRGVVRLTGPAPDPDAFDGVLDGAPAPIDIHTDASFSDAELSAEQMKVQDLLDEIQPGASTSTDPRNGSVVVHIPDDSASARSAGSDTAATVRAVTEVPVSVRYDSEPARTHQLYGGDRIGTGGTDFLCTTGFTVVHDPFGTPTEAVLTAAHCDDGDPTAPLPQFGYAGSFQFLDPFLDEAQNSNADIAVWGGRDLITQNPVGAEPEFYGQSQNPGQRATAMSAVLRQNQVIGTPVCHQGANTGYSCGEIVATNTTTCFTGGSCDPVWVRVEGDDLACAGGDSGGPWFAGSAAYGIHHGGPVAGCEFAIYTAIDKKSQVNSVIMLG